jgi:Bacterial Ig-like domain
MTDSRWIDPEIDDIFAADPELLQLAHLVRSARPEPPLDPRFQAVLRAQLMREAPAALGSPTTVARPRTVRPRTTRTSRRVWWRRSTPFASGGAGLGAALVAAAVLTLVHTPVQDQVTAASPVAELHAVSPDNIITVAFNEPMNHAAVVAGLHISPATQVSTAWQGNNLLITPTHHLTGNTPYSVTIARTATLAANGQLAASDIHITFGTAPTPPPAPSVAQLVPHTLGPVSNGAQLISAGDGTVIATSSTAATTPTATSTATPSTSASPSSSGAVVLPSISASPVAGELVSMSAATGVTDLGPGATSAALDPNGIRLIAAVPVASGTRLDLVPLDGSSRSRLATLASAVLATGWLSGDTALAAESDRIVSVDLQGHVSTLVTLPPGTTTVVFSANGQAFAGSTTGDGVLIDLDSLVSRPLPGSREVAAFSGDGSTVAWVDSTSSPTRLLTSPVSHQATATVPLDSPTDTISAIALDPGASHLAIVDQAATAGAELDVLSLPSGTIIARGPEASDPVYATRGDRLAFVSGGTAQIAPLPGVQPGTAVNLLPSGAATTLDALVDAQVSGDAISLAALGAPGLNILAATPSHLSRGYLVSAVGNQDGTVTATARLIADPTTGHAAASFVDETLALAPRAGGGYLVSSLHAGALQDEPIGPHVVSVAPVSGSTLVLRVSFDSDLRAASVASAITVTTRGGAPLRVITVYDADSRTATITVTVSAGTAVRLTIGTTLVDVDGQALSSPFTAVSGG